MGLSLGDRLRELRKAIGMSQEELGAGLVTGSYVSLIESGKRAPFPEVLVGLAERLGTTAEYLMTGDTEHDHQEDQLRLRFAEIALANGDADAAHAGFLALADRPGPELRRAARWGLARAEEIRGSYRSAVTILEDLLAPARSGELGAPPLLTLHMARCRVYRQAGDVSRSIEIGEQALAEVAELGLTGTELEIQLASTLVGSYWRRGDLLSAEVLASQVIERAEKLGSRDALGAAYWNACVVAQSRGDVTLAISLAERTLALISEGSPARAVAGMRVTYSWLLLRCDPPRIDEAEVQLQRAHAALSDADGQGPAVQACETELARAAMLRGDLEKALAFADSALGDDLAAFPNQDALLLRGLVLVRMGRAVEGMSAVAGAARHLESAGAQPQAAQAWRELAETLLQLGDRDNAITALIRTADSAGIRSALPRSARIEGSRGNGDRHQPAAPG